MAANHDPGLQIWKLEVNEGKQTVNDKKSGETYLGGIVIYWGTGIYSANTLSGSFTFR